MCKLFVNADERLWIPSTRSVRVDDVVTSIRLELFFWNVLQDIADEERLSISQLISKLYFESMGATYSIDNFTSFLRVCCTRYLSIVPEERLNS